MNGAQRTGREILRGQRERGRRTREKNKKKFTNCELKGSEGGRKNSEDRD